MKTRTLCLVVLPLLGGPLAAQACGGTTLIAGDGGTREDSPLGDARPAADAAPPDATGDAPLPRDASVDTRPKDATPLDAVCEVVEMAGNCVVCGYNTSEWYCEGGYNSPVCPPGTANDVSCKGWDSGSHSPVAFCLQACPPEAGGPSGVSFTCEPGKTWYGPDPITGCSPTDD
jgi:hypothetical protein